MARQLREERHLRENCMKNGSNSVEERMEDSDEGWEDVAANNTSMLDNEMNVGGMVGVQCPRSTPLLFLQSFLFSPDQSIITRCGWHKLPQ